MSSTMQGQQLVSTENPDLGVALGHGWVWGGGMQSYTEPSMCVTHRARVQKESIGSFFLQLKSFLGWSPSCTVSCPALCL
jgi:hypothetical protein